MAPSSVDYVPCRERSLCAISACNKEYFHQIVRKKGMK